MRAERVKNKFWYMKNRNYGGRDQNGTVEKTDKEKRVS